MNDTETTALPSGGPIADTVAAHLQSPTRFRRADISQQAPDRQIVIDLTLTLIQQVSFDVVWHAGPRQLPPGITLLGTGSRLKVELTTQLRQARDGCDDALRAWVASEPQTYRRMVPPEAAFRHTPGQYGIEFTCQSCIGKCQVQCDGCSGAGRVSCTACHGAGAHQCHQCGGTTRFSCASCAGTGHVTEQVSEQRWDATANADVTKHVPVNRLCLSCSGFGSLHCPACTSGQVPCGACAGRRTVACNRCAGVGCFDCAGCAASGVQHEWACVSAMVSTQEDLSFGVVDAALEALIRERIAPADLPSYGRLLSAHHVVADAALGSRYELRFDALHATLETAARSFTLYGLGPQAQVVDFGNITSHLLQDGLVTLERAAVPVPVWVHPDASALPGAFRQFVASELNLLIAENLGPQQAGSPSAAAAVDAHFKNMVDTAYVQRASVALRHGMSGLYGAALLYPALSVAGGAALVSILVYAFGPAQYDIWHCAGWAVLAGAVGWAGVEVASLKRILRDFPAPIGARLQPQFKASASATKWRVAVAAGVIVSALLGSKLAATLPFIAKNHQGQVAQTADVKPKSAPYSIENSRTTANMEGLYEIRQEARRFLAAHNKKHKTRFEALEPNLKAQYPKCSTRMTAAWVPKSYKLSSPAVFVRCKKSVSKHARKWEAIVQVSKRE